MTSDPLRAARRALRSEYRARRRAIPPAERAAAAASAARLLAAARLPRPGSSIAAYVPNDGEFDPAPLLELARRRGCRVYMPVLTRRRTALAFGPLDAPAPAWRRNRYGILEPSGVPALLRRPHDVDLVLVPLVAFDAHGRRLGMGAGYYDRAFAFLLRRTAWRRPRLLGLAFDAQQADSIADQPWDVPLWGVLTESRLLRP
jgi:5-formyltetrahydrofolate cyclo-ligase